MSARGEGSWQQFRSAVEELHLQEVDSAVGQAAEAEDAEVSGLPQYWVLRLNLQRLGHAEFAAGAGGRDWRVTPPVLAVTKHPNGVNAVLVGARSDNLLRRLADSGDDVRVERESCVSCPDLIRVQSPDEDALLRLVERAVLRIQREAPTAILLSLPPVDDPGIQQFSEIPIGVDWKIERFSATTLGWASSTRDDIHSCVLGLFRFTLRYQRRVLLCIHGVPYAMPAQVGKYVVLRRRRRWVLRYDSAHQRLSLPASCRPPFLVERALILCSGALPLLEPKRGSAGILHYCGVPRAVAQLASAVLRQEFRNE